MNALMILIVIVLIVYVIIKLSRGSVKHSAVQNSFLAKYTYQKLTDLQKQDVKNKTLDILKRSGMLEKDFEAMGEILKFSFFALAMNELGIKPALYNEQFHYVKNPYAALSNAEHAVNVVRNHLKKTHNLNVELDIPNPLVWHKLFVNIKNKIDN